MRKPKGQRESLVQHNVSSSATTLRSAFPSCAPPTSDHTPVAPSHQSTATELEAIQTGLFISQAK